MERKTVVRLADIAERLNVSTVTVSKALADKEGVGDELRQKIKDFAEQMGYEQKKSRKARADFAARTGNIGIVVPARFFDRTGASFYWAQYDALSRELMSQGYYAIIEQLESGAEFDLELPRVVRDGKVDGVVMMGQVSEDYANFFTRNYSRFVFLDFYAGSLQVDSVVTDNFYMEYLLTQHLIDMGHRDIRFVGTFNRTSSVNDRFMGFMKAMLENGLRTGLDDVIPDCDLRGEKVPLVLPGQLPTAFACNCDECAVRLVRELQARGVRVPDDVSVVGFDDYIHSPYEGPALTTVSLDFENTSRVVLDLLLKKIAGRPYSRGYTLVGGSLSLRDSVRNLNA